MFVSDPNPAWRLAAQAVGVAVVLFVVICAIAFAVDLVRHAFTREDDDPPPRVPPAPATRVDAPRRGGPLPPVRGLRHGDAGLPPRGTNGTHGGRHGA